MIQLLATFALILTLTGCTNLTSSSLSVAPNQKLPWQVRQISLNRLKNWQISGKIGLHTPTDSGSANVSWYQAGSQYTLSLLGPFGMNGFQLQGRPGLVYLKMQDGTQYSATNAENLLRRAMHFQLPVSNLYYWIRGLPAPLSANHIHLDAAGRLSELKQQGWTIQYLSYTQQDHLDLPSKILMSTSDMKIKLIIYTWNLN